MTKIKRKDRGLFEYQERIERLSQIKMPLDKLNLATDWEIFRPITRYLSHRSRKPHVEHLTMIIF